MQVVHAPAAVQFEILDRKTGYLHDDRRILEREAHLKHRVVGRLTRDVGLLDDKSQWHILRALNANRALSGRVDQVAERHRVVHLHRQRQRVDEQPEQVLEFGFRPIGKGHAHEDQFLPRVAMQQNVVDGEHDNERRHAARLREVAGQFRKLRSQRLPQFTARERLNPRAGIVDGQIDAANLRRQNLRPDAQPIGDAFGGLLFVLPHGVVGVLDLSSGSAAAFQATFASYTAPNSSRIFMIDR